jgi:4-hydroxybenzoate polyprenyltransferase
MKHLMWLVTLASLIGTVANVRRRRWCFIIWGATNALWTIYDAALGAWPQAALMACYFGLAIWGWVSWGKIHHRDTENTEKT